MPITAEKNLQTSGTALSLMKMGHWEWNTRQDKLEGSASFFSIIEMPAPADGLLSMSAFTQMIHPADVVNFNNHLKELRAGRTANLQMRIFTPAQLSKYIHFVGATKSVESGELVTEGFCRDITLEKTATEVLRDTIAELEFQLRMARRAGEVAQSGTWQINLDTHETFYSDNIFHLYGVAPQSLPAHLNTFASFIHPEDRDLVTEMSDAAFRNKLPLHIEYRIIRTDGEERYIRVMSEVSKSVAGEQTLTGISQDITEQKQLEQQFINTNDLLSIRNKHFRHVEKFANMGVWQVNLQTRETRYSDNLYRIYGLKPQSIPADADNFISYVYNEDRGKVEAARKKAFEEKIAMDVEFRIIRKDGKIRTLSQHSMVIITPSKENMLIGLVQDLTHEKQLQQQLQELTKELQLKDDAFEQAEQTANIGSWRLNLDTHELFFSDNMYRIFGIKPQSLTPGFETFRKFIHPNDIERLKLAATKMQSDAQRVEIDYRIYRADGSLRYLRTRNRIATSAGGERMMIGTTQDVTDELKLSNMLKEQVRFANMLSNTILNRMMVTNAGNTIIGWNKACENYYKLDKEEVLGKNIFEVFPTLKKAHILEYFERALSGEVVHKQDMVSEIDRNYIDLHMVPLKDEDDKVVGLLHILRDVNEEHHLKQQLKQRLYFIESLVDATVARVMALDKDLNFTLWNRKAEAYYGLPKEKMLGKNLLQLYPAFKKFKLYDEFRKALAGQDIYIAPNDDEREGYHEAHLVPLRDEQQQVTGILWIIIDLTERRNAEKAVEESRELLQQTTDAIPDSIAIYDLNENTTFYLNNRLAEWIGISPEKLEVIGFEGRLLLVHPDDRHLLSEFDELLRQSADNEVKSIEYRLLTRQKKYLTIRNRSKIFKRDATGNITHVLSVLQDITEQKQAEEELLRLKDEFTRNVTNKYNVLLNSIDEGFCTIAVKFDDENNPIDYQLLEVSPSFEQQTGVANAAGKWMSEIGADTEGNSFQIFGRVALTGETRRFEFFSAPLNRWWSVYAFRIDDPVDRKIGVLFNDITKGKESEERQRYLLKLSDAIRSLAAPANIKSTAVMILGRHLNVSHCFFYEVIQKDGADFLVMDETYSAAGISTPPVQRYPLHDSGSIAGELRAGRNMVVNDMDTAPGISSECKAIHPSLNVQACVMVPLIKNKRLVAVLGGHQTKPRNWTAKELLLMQDTIERTWDAVERANAQEALRMSEANYRIRLEEEVKLRIKDLKEGKELLQSIFENSVSSIMLLKPVYHSDNKIADFEYVLTNIQLLKSIHRHSLAGKKMGEEFPGVIASGILKKCITVFETRKPLQEEMYIDFDGFDNWYLVHASRVNDYLMVSYSNISPKSSV